MKGKFSIIKNAYLWLIFGLVIVLGSWLLFGLNVNFSSQFTGGVTMTLSKSIENKDTKDNLENFLSKNGFGNSSVEINTNKSQTDITIKTNVGKDENVNELSKQISNFLTEQKIISKQEEIVNLTITGPSVGGYMQKATLWALGIGVLFMAIYMLFSFATIRKYIPPTVLALVTIVTMLFDISLPSGAYGFWMMVNSTVQVDTIFVIAILTTMGYSINDTIIIFDRVRENIQEHSEKKGGNIVYGDVFEKSLRQTMRRSLGTSISTLLVIIAMFILGSGVIKGFAFTIGVGVIAGTFSSIFIAAPLAYILIGKFEKKATKK